MEIQETPEQRSERLSVEAQRLADIAHANSNISDRIRILSKIESETNHSLTELFQNGNITFPIGDHIIYVEYLPGETRIKDRRIRDRIHNYLGYKVDHLFDVSINGQKLDAILLSYTDDSFKTKFLFHIPEPTLRDEPNWPELQFADGENPYSTLFWIIGKPSFPTYLAYREQLVRSIGEEAARFREVLVRKFQQLTYIDEYETREIERFLEEAKRFTKKRLPKVPSQLAVARIVRLVSEWAAEVDARSDDGNFDASMSPTDYERFCADRFAAAGWNVRLTKGSGDQGADIICDANGRRLVVQCKLYSSSVGNAAVQEVIAARQFEYANSAAVVSNATYTTAARELASTARVHLLHHDEICNIKP
jgi:restriction system protein